MRPVRLLPFLLVTVAFACSEGEVEPGQDRIVSLTIPSGVGFRQVVDTLEAKGLVDKPTLFRLYARFRKADRNVRSGTYALRASAGWGEILDHLVAGRVVTVPLTIPEGFTIREIAPRVATITGDDAERVAAELTGEDLAEEWNVPGPGLEGYLFPDTYLFAEGTALEVVVRTMVDEYRAFWTPERRERLEELGMTEQEIVTLASIVQAEARKPEEMPLIASVYHNRIREGWPLQADPTVLYALGGPRPRLLYAAIDSVANDPYNTYTFPGLPPGPIGAPGRDALEASLHPAEADYMFFVATPDGSHTFTRTLAEHNRARIEARAAWDQAARTPQDTTPPGGSGSP